MLVVLVTGRKVLAACGIAGCDGARGHTLRLADDQHQGKQNDHVHARHSEPPLPHGRGSVKA